VLGGKIAPEHMAPQLGNLDARLVAMKQMVVDAAAAWVQAGKDLSAKGANASAAEIAEFLRMTNRLSMIHAEFLGKRAEVARALNAMKVISESGTNLEAITRILKEHGGSPEEVAKLAELAAKADNPAQAAAMARKFVKPTVMSKILEVWKAMMLSGPKTHLANLLGNINGLIIQPADRLAAAGIGMALRTPKAERVRFAEAHAEVNGMVHGVMDGLRLAGDIVRGKEPLDPAKADALRGGAIEGTTGEVVRIPFRGLSASDALFRTMAERGEAYALATRQAINENFAPGTREYHNRIMEIVANPTEEMQAAMIDAGHRAVYTRPLGKLGAALSAASHDSPLGLFLPFVRTPANILKWGLEHSPTGLILPSVRADLKAGGAARDLALGRMVVGTVVGAIILGLEKDGIVTGGGLSEPEKLRSKKLAGWQPYSIKVGDTYYSYARLDPVGRLLSAAADTSELLRVVPDAKKDAAPMIVASIGNATISQTYLSGLANLVNAATDPTRYGARFFDQYAASLVPGAIGQAAVAKDPYVREINSALDAIQSRIPIMREQLLPKRNPLTGEPIKGAESALGFLPISTSTDATDKVLTEAARLGIPISSAPKKVHVGRGTGKPGDVKITPEDRNAYTEVQGKFAHEILTPFVNSPMWDALPDFVRTKVYKDAIRRARRQGALAALTPEERMAESGRIIEDIKAALTPPAASDIGK